jgi:hypothetical protein
MGPKIQELAFFSSNWPPFNLDFVQEFVEKFSNWSIFGRLADSLFFKMARNMGPQIIMIEVSNYTAGDKYRRGGPEICHTNFTST